MRKNSKITTALFAAVALTTGLGLAGASPALADHHKEMSQPNVVQAAQSTGVHNTLVAAVQAAGLAETLSGPGPFTVFAPTDTAFAKLPAGTVETLVQPANKGTLTNILTYNVVSGDVDAATLTGLIEQHGGSYTIETLGGGELTARLAGETIVITDGAGRTTAVTQADVDVSNGVIHVTDGVFLPN
ncbi:fasciclin domain-containing protein [Alteriqipengyuania lutimaris]|uniref:Fasciclin domain-containing protein n=1 Tax=Alteriqipengyuania lutimaris TaxID=1538146 RepID=A0A395LSD6_9SPHN|nr:fasciclin domain-containing protein [Alteriqipengyuania lutimaris]MBB3033509.1 putative surface protein with fasciclin (FAS1) repeats [Alteriqipengyuania lutimaris]RDS77480.1 fasciclin domain-containing protein [Alteriqipengyuania lutimaris]